MEDSLETMMPSANISIITIIVGLERRYIYSEILPPSDYTGQKLSNSYSTFL